MKQDYSIEQTGPIRTRGEILFDRICYACIVLVVLLLVPGFAQARCTAIGASFGGLVLSYSQGETRVSYARAF